MFNRKCKITFICHGTTIYTEENRISDGEKYPPLNDVGYNDIEKICEYLKKRGVKNDKIYCSSALRTMQSAQMIAKVFKKDFEVLEDLTPLNYGELGGLTKNQIDEKYPNLVKLFATNAETFAPKNGETVLNFYSRTSKIIKKIVEENISKRIIIVTYPEVIQAAIGEALDIKLANLHKIHIKSGSATQISYFEDWASLVYSDYVPM